MKMSNVREAIELLCKVLHCNGTSKVKAEIFRLAKFDNSEATLCMWKLLFELLYYLEHGIIDEVVIRAYNELTTEEQAVYIKQGLQEMGFYSKEFASLPNDMSSGSRELLLAFAWLFGTQNIADKFMECCASPISSDFPEARSILLEPNKATSTHNLTPVEKVQQLQHLNGKMLLSLKRLFSLQRERRKLQHKVHESTIGATSFADRSHLSVLEVHLLRHPDYLKKLLKLLEKDNVRLQHMLQWKEQENVFWKWMESVLDLKLQERSTSEDKSQIQFYNIPPDILDNLNTERNRLESSIIKYETVIEYIEEIWETKESVLDLKLQERSASEDKSQIQFYNIPPDILDNLNTERNRLESAIIKYDTIIEHIEEIWETKVEDVSQSQLDRLLHIIDLELEFHKSNIGLDKSNMRKSKYTEPQFMFVKPTSKKASNIQRVENLSGNSNDGLEVTIDVADEIHDMELRIERLELQAKQKENFYRQELDRLAANIPESVCIQPTSLR